MSGYTKLYYNSGEERIEAIVGDDYDTAVVVYSPFSAPVDPVTRKYVQSTEERRLDALNAISLFVQDNPNVREGSDGQVWRADYCDVVLPVRDFVSLWLQWYFGGGLYIEPGHALWERTAGGSPMRCMDGSAYTIEDAIREGGYVPTPAYWAMVGKPAPVES